MDKDTFIRSKKNISQNHIVEEENNFFVKQDSLYNTGMSESTRHINDYDFNILKEDAYKDIKDDIFKLEYKISKAESLIKDIDNQIQAAKDILDFGTAERLFEKRKQVQLDIRKLYDLYTNASISAKISENLISKIKNQTQYIKDIIFKFAESFSKIFPNRMTAFFEIKNSLTKLENINKSVDELIALKIPYGESADKYEQLSKYITKANSIQSSISKYIKQP